MHLVTHLRASIDGQYRHPQGLIGRAIGARMVRQHEPEMQWTISTLALEPHDQVLEIGFGAGRAIERIAPLITQGHITGIDLSATMLDAARHRNRRQITAGKIDLHQGDVTKLPFVEQRFDKIVSIHTIYFWSDMSQALREVYRVLKPHGSINLTFSPGTIDAQGVFIATPLLAYIEGHIIPEMSLQGFTEVSLRQGPHSRQFATMAIVGIK